MAGRKPGRIPSKVDADGLTPKRRRFCLEYLVDLNATQAAIRAGYAAASAHVEGSRLLADAKVQAFLAPRLERKEKRLELTASRLDSELARCAYLDPAKLVDDEGRRLELHQLDEDTRRAIVGVKFRVSKVVHGKEAQRVADRMGVSDAARGVEDAPRPVEEVTLGTVEFRLAPKVEAIGLAYRRLGLLKDKLEIKGKVRNLSHEEVLLLAQRIRAKQLAARAGAVGGTPGAPARGHR